MMKTSFLLLCAVAFTAFAAVGAAAQNSRAAVSAGEVNGTYRMNFQGKYKKESNEIKLLALGKGKIRVGMELMYPFMVQGEMSANLGQLDGQASIAADTAIYQSTEFGPCTITIKFVRPGTIKVTQDGSDADCGFGHNVMAGGTYRKISGAKPKFEEQ